MLKRSFTAVAAILLAACADSPAQPSGELLPTAAALSNGANGTVVCHLSEESGQRSLLGTNASALGAHLGHGDFQAGSARLLADGYIIFNGARVRGPFPHEYWIEVTCNGFAGTGQFPAGASNPIVTEAITGTYDGTTMTFLSDYDNSDYWYGYGPGPANGTGPGAESLGRELEIEVSLIFR